MKEDIPEHLRDPTKYADYFELLQSSLFYTNCQDQRLKTVANAYNTNLEILASTVTAIPILCSSLKRSADISIKANIDVFGKPFPDEQEVRAKDKGIQYEHSYTKFTYQSVCDTHLNSDSRSKALLYGLSILTRMLSQAPAGTPIPESILAIFRLSVLHSWTTFEVLIEDIARILSKHLDEINFQIDAKNIGNRRNAMSKALGDHVAKDALGPYFDRLYAHQEIRHALIHNAGRVDRKLRTKIRDREEAFIHLCDLKLLLSQRTLVLDGNFSANLIEPTIKCCNHLIAYFDRYLIEHSTD